MVGASIHHHWSDGVSNNGPELRQRILEAFEQRVRRDGCPPTVRELKRAAGVKSTSHVAHHLKMLEKQGLITNMPGVARGRQLCQPPGVAVWGTIAAGVPLTIYEPDKREILDLGEHLREPDALRAEYALLVKGDSMIDDHIFDGDFVLVRPGKDAPNGAIVVAVHLLAGGERGAATVKRFYRDRVRHVVRLVPANAAIHAMTIPATEWDREWTIQGTVTGVYRSCIPLPTAPCRRS